MRLNRYLAACGCGSRRACDRLIEEGAVALNGESVSGHGFSVSEGDEVLVHGVPVQPEARRIWMLNKPRNVISTAHDPQGRRTVLEFLPADAPRVVPVGRLDRLSEGLLLLSNEGELINRLLHPRHHVKKRYRVRLDRLPDPGFELALRKGVEEGGEHLRVADMRTLEEHWVEMTLAEGKNRQIRRMLSVLGYEACTLRRVGFGPLTLGTLPLGGIRELTDAEYARLRDAADY